MTDKRPSARQEEKLRSQIAYDMNELRKKRHYWNKSKLDNTEYVNYLTRKINDLRFISYEDYAWCKLQEEVY